MFRILLVAVPLGAVVVLSAAVRWVRAGAAQQRWVRGRALVLEVERSRAGEAGAAPRYCVRARVRTADGREAFGWAAGDYGRAARHWAGAELDAWYDAGDPRRFTLTAPDPTVVLVLKVLLILLPVLSFLALLAVIYHLES